MIGVTIPSYERFAVGGARVVATMSCAASIREVLERERLYEYAARQPDAVPLVGRAPVFAISLPGACGRVVVRHNMRGGWMAKINKDLFVLPTRGFRELIASLRLRASGVSTPEVVAYVSYPKNWILRRSDVATREIVNGHDLSVALTRVTDHAHRVMVLDAVVKLLRALTHAGAHHPDLNLKNVLLTAGAFVIAAGFSAAKLAGGALDTLGLYEAIGIAVMFAGFLSIGRFPRAGTRTAHGV
jgi:tRNA A-37 threonylcarbamoyl transferase component Bud32